MHSANTATLPQSVLSTPAPTSTPLKQPSLSGHIPALDGIRGIAILMVTAFRFDLGPECEWLPGKILFKALSQGDLGVDLFFVLSGFLITGILFDAKETGHYFRNFYARRALRIYPLYYAMLFAFLVVWPRLFADSSELFAEAREHQAWLWLYGANFYMGLQGDWCLGSFTHFWSLCVEEHFYIFWPLVIFFCNRRQAMIACALAIAFSVFGRMVWLVLGGSDVAAQTSRFFRFDGLALGGLLTLAARGQGGIRKFIPWALLGGGLTFAMMCGIAVIKKDGVMLGLPMAVCAAFFGAVVVLAVAANQGSMWGRFWGSKILRFFGKYSYAMYVFQKPLIALMAPILTAEGLCALMGTVLWGRLAYMTLMFAITTALAYVSWYAFEKHFLALKTRFQAHA